MSDYLQNMKSYLKIIDEVIENGKYKDTWVSLANYKVADWYKNAKFGIFIHWGAYAVPAYNNEWYARHMYIKDREKTILTEQKTDVYKHHVETFGEVKNFGYREFIPMFKAEKFNAKEWAELFKEAGAKFVMPVAEHHDGFQMYNSELSEWCAAKKGPMKDIVGELKRECEARDMQITVSSHRVEHYWFMGGMRDFDSDFAKYADENGNLPYGDIYWPSYPMPFGSEDGITTRKTNHTDVNICDIDPLFMEDWLARTCELVDKYRPKIVYFDWWIQVRPMKPYLRKFAAYYYNRALEWGEEVAINYKNDAFQHTSAVRDIERGQLSDISAYFWQNDTAVAKNSWCYTEGNNYKKPQDVINDLIDVVSKNGSLLLNVGPKADGTIPKEDADILRAVGKWLAVNGEGIYETVPFRKCGEGPTVVKEGHFTDTIGKEFTSEDFRFTSKPNALYVFCLKWPEDSAVKIKTLGYKDQKFNPVIKKVEILGQEGECSYHVSADALSVVGKPMYTVNPVCIKITID